MSEDEDRKVDLEKAEGAAPPPEPAPAKPKRKRKPKPVAAELPLEPVEPSEPAPDDDVRYRAIDAEIARGAAAIARPAPPVEDAAHAQDATEEVTVTRPTEAPLPDDMGLAHAFSPVDLPEPAEPLQRPFLWTTTVIAVASLLLALFNAEAIRGWANELPAGPISARIVEGADQWYVLTDSVGLTAPTATMRGWWDAAQAARFGNAPPAEAANETAPAGAP